MYSVVASTSAKSTNNISVTTSAIDTTGANLLIVTLADYDGVTTTLSAITDSKSNSWNALTTKKTATGERSTIFWSIPTSVGSGHTFTATGVANTFPSVGVLAVLGAKTSSPFDVQNGATATSTTLQPGSITPTENNELVITAIAADTEATGFSIDSGFTLFQNLTSSANSEGGGGAYLIQTSAAAVNPTWTTNNNIAHSATIASFKFNPATGQFFAVF